MTKTRLIFGFIFGIIASIYLAKGERVTASIGTMTAAVGALSINEWGVIVGIISVPISLFFNYYFKKKQTALLRDALKKGASAESIIKSERLKI